MDYDKIIALIHSEVKPALGCTEPIAVALAVARAAEALREGCGCEATEITASMSANILKNGMGVGIPGTGMVGLHVAAALGAICGRSCFGLEVLHDLCPEAVEKARKLVAAGKVTVTLAPTDEMLYVFAEARAEGHTATAIISGAHDRIVSATFDGASVLSVKKTDGSTDSGTSCTVEPDFARNITVKEIWEFVNTVPLEKIAFMEDSITMNRALAEEGLRHPYGLQVGRTLLADDNKSVYGDTLLIHAMAWTAAASDARMAGCTLSAMSNSGSGNQGVTATMPVVAIAEKTGATHEQLLRALALSHLTAIHIKGYLGKLSALCGCVIASTGSACGIVYLRRGGYDQVCAAIKNMIGNITGMVCDGAKVGCALKVASGVATALQSAVLALDGQCISANDGIIEEDIEKTIANLGRIGSIGMKATDKMILDIMSCK